MSNPLHETATRVVSIALFPVFIALGGALLWHLRPPPQTLPIDTETPRVFDDTVSVPDLRPMDEVVEIATQIIQLEPRVAKAAEPEPVKVCEQYPAGSETVTICTWH